MRDCREIGKVNKDFITAQNFSAIILKAALLDFRESTLAE